MTNPSDEIQGIIDYPQAMEVVTSPHYTFRFSPSDATVSVELSLNGGPWRECRRARGYFWFDWSHFPSGSYEIHVLARMSDGRTEAAGSRWVRVQLEQDAD